MQRGDITVFRVQFDTGNLALDPLCAIANRHVTQKLGETRGVELVSIVQPVIRQMRELALKGGHQLQAIVVIRGRMAILQAMQPEMLEARRPVVLARQAEGVEVTRADVFPVVE